MRGPNEKQVRKCATIYCQRLRRTSETRILSCSGEAWAYLTMDGISGDRHFENIYRKLASRARDGSCSRTSASLRRVQSMKDGSWDCYRLFLTRSISTFKRRGQRSLSAPKMCGCGLCAIGGQNPLFYDSLQPPGVI